MSVVVVIVLALVFFIADQTMNRKQGPSGTCFPNHNPYDIESSKYVDSKVVPGVDMLLYLHSKNIYKKFDNVEVFLDWVQENIPHDYEHNFWIKYIREEWPKFNPSSKHRQHNNKLAWHNK